MKRSARGLVLSSSKGFTLVELLVVIVIIAILAAVVVVIVNPAELQRRARDSARMQDLDNIQKAIGALSTNTNNPNDIVYCFGGAAPCSGNSNDPSPTVRSINGSGWVKVNLSAADTVTFTILPIDPVNNSTYHYSYASDGTSFELDAKMESLKFQSKMTDDGGDNPNKYEVGSSLTLIN